jgi:hypothetical protein
MFLSQCIRAIVEELGFPKFNSRADFEGISHRIYISEDPDECLEDVTKIRLNFLLVKAYLQLGAVFSKQGSHENALESMLVGRFFLLVLIFNLTQLVRAHVAVAKQLELEQQSQSQHSSDAYFEPDIQQPMLRKFQSHHSPIVSTFLLFCEEAESIDPLSDQFMSQDSYTPLMLWRHNSENNERYIRKELSSRRSEIVTEKLTAFGIKEFKIASVMQIRPLSYVRLVEKVPFAEFFGAKFAVELILTYSCALFAIANESKLICQERLSRDSKGVGDWQSKLSQQGNSARNSIKEQIRNDKDYLLA